MDKFYKSILFIFYFCSSLTYSFAQQWTALGPEENTYEHPIGLYTSLALSKTGQPFVAFQDNSNLNKCAVITYSNGSWSTLGSQISSGTTYFTDIALNSQNVPYVVFVDGDQNNKVSVKKYNGSTWDIVGTLGFSSGTAGYSNIAISPADEPYVCYIDGSVNDKITVKKFDGTNWITVGTEGFSSGSVQYPKIAFSSSGEPYVVYQDAGINFRIRVSKFVSESGWGMIGSVVSPVVGDYPDIVIDQTGAPVVSLWNSAAKEVLVRKWISNAWVNQGTIPTYTNSVRGTTLKLSKYDTPHLLITGSQENVVYKKDTLSTTWVNFSNISYNSGNAEYGDIAFFDDQLWAASSSSNARIYIARNISSTWDDLVTKGSISTSSSNTFPLMAFDKDGVLYTAYQDGGRTTLRSRVNYSWRILSNHQPTNSNELVGLEVSQTNSTRYLVYKDILTYPNTYQVVRQVGSVWSNLGAAVTSENFIALKTNSKGELYIILKNGIKKLQSNIWVDIASNVTVQWYAFDTLGNIWALFTESGGYKLKKYISSVWTEVVTIPLSYYNSKFALDANDQIYIIGGSHIDQGVFVHKYTGSSWQMLGSFVHSYDLYPMLNSEIPYGVFFGSDNAVYAYISASKVEVLKLVNNNWKNLLLPNSNSNYGIAASNKNNSVIAMYKSTDGLYAKVYGDYIVLPATLLNYKVSKTSTSVNLNWSTSIEQNNDYFTIERSSNGKDFVLIGKVASKGSTSVLSAYSSADFAPENGINYYRLSQVDKDGTKTVLGIKEVNFAVNQLEAAIYPNPIEGSNFIINLPRAGEDGLMVRVSDVTGKTIFSEKLNSEGNKISVNLGIKPASGIYFVGVDGFKPIKLLVK